MNKGGMELGREEVLKGRVVVGMNPTYQIIEKGNLLRMVAFIDTSGDVLYGSYGHLQIACATEEYLSLEFARHKVLVKGRNLASVARAVAAHRLVYLKEKAEPEPVSDSEPFVQRMLFVMSGGSDNLRDYVVAV